MKSLPDAPIFLHCQKTFIPHPNPGLCIHSTPYEEEEVAIHKSPVFNKITYNNKLKLKKEKKSNVMQWLINKKEKNIFYYVFKIIIFPQLLAFLFILLLMIIENKIDLYCYEGDFQKLIYLILRSTIFSRFYYNWAVDLCLFETKTKKIVKIIMFLGVLLMIFFIDYYSRHVISFGAMNLDVFLFPVLFQILLFLLYQFKSLSTRNILKIFIILIFFILFFIDHYAMRQFLIQLIYMNLEKTKGKNIIFQSFLFVFYQIYGRFFLWILAKLRKKMPSNLFFLLIKYHINHVLCSCVILTLISLEEKYTQLFAIFNYALQIMSLYVQDNVLLHYFYIIFHFAKRRNHKKENNEKNDLSEIKSIIAGMTNEAVYTIIFTLLNIIIFKRTFGLTIYDF